MEFVDIYGHNPSKSLKLEDMTRNDIYTYVSDNFNSHEQFSRLRDDDSDYESLISEVVDRAQGVFIWVRLVVEKLLEGFTFHDSVNTLKRRLTSFPKSLQGVFSQILDSFPSAHRARSAATFKVATGAYHPRLLMFYHFLDGIIEGEAPGLDSSYIPLDANSI